jgi:signal peptidase I
VSTLTATGAHLEDAETSDDRRRRGPAAWTWAYRAILLAVSVLAVYATVVPWVIQRSDERLVTITSGSMVPLLPVGCTISIHDQIDRQNLHPGQIITFKALGNGTVISHRIVARLDTPTLGGVFYQTKGDANRTADPDLAPAGNIIGVVDGVLPAWKGAAVAMQTPRGRLAVYGSLFVVIALGEVVDLVVAARRRRSAGGRPT